MTAATATPPEVTEYQRVAAAAGTLDAYLGALAEIEVVKRYTPHVPGAAGASVPRIDTAALAEQDMLARRLVDEIAERFKAVDDVVERAVQTQTLVDVIDERLEPARYKRDIGLLVMLNAWYSAQDEFKATRKALNERLANGSITREEYDALSEEAETLKRTKGSQVKWKPTPACRLARISRGLLAYRVKPRRPNADPSTVDMADAERDVEVQGRDVSYMSLLRIRIEGIRNEAIDVVLTGPPEGLGWSNASLARTLGVTTARIAQLRTGTR